MLNIQNTALAISEILLNDSTTRGLIDLSNCADLGAAGRLLGEPSTVNDLLLADVQHQVRQHTNLAFAQEHAMEFMLAMQVVGAKDALKAYREAGIGIRLGVCNGHFIVNWDGTFTGVYRAGIMAPITFDPSWLSPGQAEYYYRALNQYLTGANSAIEPLSDRLYRHSAIFSDVQAAVYKIILKDS